jgi:hypothetical protein
MGGSLDQSLQPEYWRRVEEFVGEAPSTLKLIYPEVYLGEAQADARVARIREHMDLYLRNRIFTGAEGFVYVERRTSSGSGNDGCLDLDTMISGGSSISSGHRGDDPLAHPSPGQDQRRGAP